MSYRNILRSVGVTLKTPTDTSSVNLESLDKSNQVTQSTRPVNKPTRLSKFGRAVKNIQPGELECTITEPKVVRCGMLDTYHNLQARKEQTVQWNKGVYKVTIDINNIMKQVGFSKEIVKQYQHNSESIDYNYINELLNTINSRTNSNFTINSEDIVGYAEMMNSILNNTADNIDSTRGSLATLLSKVESEINGIKVDKYKEILIKIQSDIQNKSARIVGITDALIKATTAVEDKSENSIQDVIKKMEYGLNALHKDDVTVANSIGVEQGLTNDQIVNLTQAVRNYFTILGSNKVAIDCLNSTADDDTTWQNDISNTLSSFVVKVLPGLNTAYKTLLKVLHTEDPMVKTLQPNEITNKIKTDINKYIAAFAESVGVDNDNKLYLYHQDGYYILKEDKTIAKVNIPDDIKLPVLSNEKLTYLTNVLQTINITSSLLTQFPASMVLLLKSRELEVNETNHLHNIVLVLGVITTLANLYRDEVIYGIYGLHKSLSEIGNAYFNIVNCIEKISNGQLKNVKDK